MELPIVPEELAARLEAGLAVAWSEPVEIPTYEPAAPDRYPQFFEKRVYQGSSGKVYPLPMTDRIATEPVLRRHPAIHLENRFVRLMVLPEYGGRVHVGYDKVSGYDFLYRNRAIKPALVGLAGPWLSGGIEFNWPQHHRPATFLPTSTHNELAEDGSATVWCSDHDPLTHMKGMHGIRLLGDSAALELHVRLHNRTNVRQTFLWWANAAVHVHDDYQSFFPPDVNWVADHARRAVTAFPSADRAYYGVDYPARGAAAARLDYANNIPVPTSYMVTATDDNFFGGYDHRARAGLVHVADRDIAPGKKQWTWGNAPFGDEWAKHLTDEDGPYIELMAGVYTDNQPDFSYLEPGETKVFQQTWYPYHGIGVLHHATVDVGVHLSTDGEVVSLGIVAAAVVGVTEIVLERDGRELGRWPVELDPTHPFAVDVVAPAPTTTGMRVRVGALLDWTVPALRQEPEPAVATAPMPPVEVLTADELHQIAVHLAQYRHPTRSPDPYWNEILRRDPGDARANLAVATGLLAIGGYDEALAGADRALARLTGFNANPHSGAASMLRGHALLRLGRSEEARRAFAKARWNAAERHSASYEIARIDLSSGAVADAIGNAQEALRFDADDLRVRALLTIALRLADRGQEAAELLEETRRLDPLDGLARHLDGAELPDDALLLIDVATDLASFGRTEDALTLLEAVTRLEPTPAGNFAPAAAYRAALIADRAGSDGREWRFVAQTLDRQLAFPSGLDDYDALVAAIAADSDDAGAHAMLGMLLYDAGRRADALEHWGLAIALDPDVVTLRNAAVATVNVAGDGPSALALYERALALDPQDARLWFESDQLLRLLGATAGERLARIPDEALSRDDLAIEVAGLLVDVGQSKRAIALLSSRRFQPWEGGEGKAIRAWQRAAGPDSPPPSGLGEVAGPDTTPSPWLRDGSVDYFATSLPDFLLFNPLALR